MSILFFLIFPLFHSRLVHLLSSFVVVDFLLNIFSIFGLYKDNYHPVIFTPQVLLSYEIVIITINIFAECGNINSLKHYNLFFTLS